VREKHRRVRTGPKVCSLLSIVLLSNVLLRIVLVGNNVLLRNVEPHGYVRSSLIGRGDHGQ
jgi:hypothetical protein